MTEEQKDVIMSIKPQFARLIYSGEKKYELRKHIPGSWWKNEKIPLGDRVFYVYETAPVKK